MHRVYIVEDDLGIAEAVAEQAERWGIQPNLLRILARLQPNLQKFSHI